MVTSTGCLMSARLSGEVRNAAGEPTGKDRGLEKVELRLYDIGL
jgi:hypothetical protein